VGTRYIGWDDTACISLSAMKKLAMMKRHNLMWSRCRFLASRTRLHIHLPDPRTPTYSYQRFFTQGVYILRKPEHLRYDGDSSDTLYLHKIAPSSNCICYAHPNVMEAHDCGCSSVICLPPVKCNSLIRAFAIDRFGHDLIALGCSGARKRASAIRRRKMNVYLPLSLQYGK
jgi:hypothetical protein